MDGKPHGATWHSRMREVINPGVMKALLLFPTPGSSPCHNEGPEYTLV